MLNMTVLSFSKVKTAALESSGVHIADRTRGEEGRPDTVFRREPEGKMLRL
jgi:hypothetical protein